MTTHLEILQFRLLSKKLSQHHHPQLHTHTHTHTCTNAHTCLVHYLCEDSLMFILSAYNNPTPKHTVPITENFLYLQKN